MANKQVGKTFGPLTVDEESGALLTKQANGLPELGRDAVGQDAHAKVVDAPARECHYLHVSVEDHGATVSLDGGTTDHFDVPANTERLFPGLAIPASSEIHAKNLNAGTNYTKLRISVW